MTHLTTNFKKKQSHLSTKGLKLIDLYQNMADQGYNRVDGSYIENAYNDFQLAKFKELILPYLIKHKIKSILDYGSGGSDWFLDGFDKVTNKSAKNYFSLDNIYKYEPARGIDQRQMSDCVICIDVLEHVFILDIPSTLRDICKNAKGLVVLNIACYNAVAMLPNGENAHITVRDPLWWKGVVDVISTEFPLVNILLICSPTFKSHHVYESWKADNWKHSDSFSIELPKVKYYGDSEPSTKSITLTKEELFAVIKAGIDKFPNLGVEIIDLLAKLLGNNQQINKL